MIDIGDIMIDLVQIPIALLKITDLKEIIEMEDATIHPTHIILPLDHLGTTAHRDQEAIDTAILIQDLTQVITTPVVLLLLDLLPDHPAVLLTDIIALILRILTAQENHRLQ